MQCLEQGLTFCVLACLRKTQNYSRFFKHNGVSLSIEDRQIIIIIFISHMITFPYFLDIDQGQNISLLTIVVFYKLHLCFHSYSFLPILSSTKYLEQVEVFYFWHFYNMQIRILFEILEILIMNSIALVGLSMIFHS